MKQSSKYRRFSEKEIRGLLDLQEKGNIPVASFCKTHRIHKATYYNWRNKYGMAHNAIAQFVPVQVKHSESEPALFGEIELSSKIIIRLYQQVDATWIKSLLS